MLAIVQGNCLDVLAQMPANSIDSVVTDPPYELGFMGKSWDRSGVAFDPATWAAVLRVLKPGGHMLAFGGSRTYHRIACAIEDAGFEIRDCLQWLYGTGFPKSLDVSKAIDKGAGAERDVVGSKLGLPGYHLHGHNGGTALGHGLASTSPETRLAASQITAPATDEARAWAGWGTALKPAYEPIVLARKPLVGTVAANVLEYGTGGINVDGCRIPGPGAEAGRSRHGGGLLEGASFQLPDSRSSMPAGRWPANVILDEHAAALLDEQTAELKGGTAIRRNNTQGGETSYSKAHAPGTPDLGYNDSGGASRFFYTAKASKSEREAGLEHLRKATAGELTGGRKEGSAGLDNPRAGAGRTAASGRANVHPTVKPIALMRYLVRLVTPPNGIVLDPFAGSGTTGCAAALERFRFLGIEMSPEYVEIASARVRHHQ